MSVEHSPLKLGKGKLNEARIGPEILFDFIFYLFCVCMKMKNAFSMLTLCVPQSVYTMHLLSELMDNSLYRLGPVDSYVICSIVG